MEFTFTLEDEPNVEDDADCASVFNSAAEWAIDTFGPQAVRDMLEAIIATEGAESN